MSQQKAGQITDSSIARIAGNVFAGLSAGLQDANSEADDRAVRWSVNIARRIAAEVERTSLAAREGAGQ